MPKAVGIDLGTTNSVVAVVERTGEDPTIIATAEGTQRALLLSPSQRPRATRRAVGTPPGRAKPYQYHLIHQAVRGTPSR